MNLSFQAMVVLAMLVQKGLSEQIDITDLLQKMEFFLNDSGQLEVFNVDDFKLDLQSVLGSNQLFDTEDI